MSEMLAPRKPLRRKHSRAAPRISALFSLNFASSTVRKPPSAGAPLDPAEHARYTKYRAITLFLIWCLWQMPLRRPQFLLALNAVLFLLVMAVFLVTLTGLPFHEWLGLAAAAVIVVHVVLQWDWI